MRFLVTQTKTYEIEAEHEDDAGAIACDIIDCVPPDSESVDVERLDR